MQYKTLSVIGALAATLLPQSAQAEILIHGPSLGVTSIQPGWGAFETAQPYGDMTPIVSGAPPFTVVTSVSTPIGDVHFSPEHEVRHIGAGWGSWSHDGPVTGEVLVRFGGFASTYTLPQGVGAFDMYIEPGPFGVWDLTVTAIDTDGASVSTVMGVEGMAGAAHIGFYTDDPDVAIASIMVEPDSVIAQAVGELRYAALGAACLGDLTEDGVVGPDDLALLLGAWGAAIDCAGQSCPDLDGSGLVDAADLAFLLGSWGSCG